MFQKVDKNAAYREYRRLANLLNEYKNHPEGSLSYLSKFYDELITANSWGERPYYKWLREHTNTLGMEQVQALFIQCIEYRIGMIEDVIESEYRTRLEGEYFTSDSFEELEELIQVLQKSGLPYIFDKDLFCIVEGPETLIDEYFFNLNKDQLSENLDNDLTVALNELKNGSTEGCFAATRRYTIKIKELKVKSEDWTSADLPFNNGNLKNLASNLFGILSGATKNQKPQGSWTLDEARFLLRTAITLHQYLYKLDSKQKPKEEQWPDFLSEPVPF